MGDCGSCSGCSGSCSSTRNLHEDFDLVSKWLNDTDNTEHKFYNKVLSILDGERKGINALTMSSSVESISRCADFIRKNILSSIDSLEVDDCISFAEDALDAVDKAIAVLNKLFQFDQTCNAIDNSLDRARSALRSIISLKEKK